MCAAQELPGRVVLIVDDDQDALDIYAEYLRYRGARAMIAHDVREAVAVLQHLRPDVVLTDFAMAGTSGLDLVEILQSDDRWRDVPVVMTSGFADEYDLHARSSEAGIAFLAKPVQLDALARVLDDSLRAP